MRLSQEVGQLTVLFTGGTDDEWDGSKVGHWTVGHMSVGHMTVGQRSELDTCRWDRGRWDRGRWDRGRRFQRWDINVLNYNNFYLSF